MLLWVSAPGEAVLQTSTSSAFASTGLEQILKNMHVVYPIFIGSFTDGCAQTTTARRLRLCRLDQIPDVSSMTTATRALHSSKVNH